MIEDKNEIIYQDKKFRLSWDKKTKVVESVALGQMSSQEFRACLDRLLAGLREKRARKCLADLSNGR